MSGGGQKAPQGYQPAQQGQADQGYMDAAARLGAGGQQLQDSVIPGYQNVTNAVTNNPYYGYAQGGANTAANLMTQSVAPNQLAAGFNLNATAGQSGATAASILANQPGMAAQYATDPSKFASSYLPYQTSASPYATTNIPDYMKTADATSGSMASAIPAATGGYGLAPGVVQAIMAMLPSSVSGMGAAGQVLNTAFDPQGQLYDRTYHQTMEQQNAINAQNGVAGSPYAAGVAGDAAKGFNIDWQNNQLGRQIAGLGAFDSSLSSELGNYTNLLNSGTADYNSLVNGATSNLTSLNNSIAGNTLAAQTAGFNSNLQANNQNFNQLLGANNQNFSQQLGTNNQNYNQLLGANSQNFNQGQSALNNSVANYNTLGNLQLSQLYGASDLATTGANNIYAASQLPSQTYLGQQQSNLDALNAQTAGTNAAYGLTQAQMDAYGNYLKIGQGATANAINATKVNNDASAANMAGWGKIAGAVAGVALAPFTGGASLALTGASLGSGGSAGASDLAMTA
jgi:hypothetical protein